LNLREQSLLDLNALRHTFLDKVRALDRFVRRLVEGEPTGGAILDQTQLAKRRPCHFDIVSSASLGTCGSVEDCDIAARRPEHCGPAHADYAGAQNGGILKFSHLKQSWLERGGGGKTAIASKALASHELGLIGRQPSDHVGDVLRSP